MLMSFAEEVPTPPANPETPPADPSAQPAPAAPAEPADPNKARIDALQSSLDAALDELSKGTEPKPTEPTPMAPAQPAAPAAPVAPAPAAPTIPAEPPKGDAAWREEVARISKQQEDFQNSTAKQLEAMQLKDEMISLTSEVQQAIIQFPHADPDKILFEIESGSGKTVAQIAKEMNDNHIALVDKISKEQEEKIKTTLAKENEGKIKVPQSSGTSSTPTETTMPKGPGYTKQAQDAAWAQATKEAKANLQ